MYLQNQLRKQAPTKKQRNLPLCDWFDLIAGTSTGGIISAAMSLNNFETGAPEFTAGTLLEFYQDVVGTMFTPPRKCRQLNCTFVESRGVIRLAVVVAVLLFDAVVIIVAVLLMSCPLKSTCVWYCATFNFAAKQSLTQEAASSVTKLFNKSDRSAPTDEILFQYFSRQKLSACRRKTLIPAYEINLHHPYLFRSWQAKQNRNRDYLLDQVVRAASK